MLHWVIYLVGYLPVVSSTYWFIRISTLYIFLPNEPINRSIHFHIQQDAFFNFREEKKKFILLSQKSRVEIRNDILSKNI